MQHWWFPANGSSYGGQLDTMFLVILYITGAVFFVVEIGLVLFLFKYRRREGVKASYVLGSTRAEIIWTTIPAVTCIALALVSQPLWSKIKDPARIPEGAIALDVTGKQFEWHIRYPGPDGRLGTDDDFEKRNELHVIVDRDYRIRLQAEDVIHSFFVPVWRFKQDAVPGMQIHAWFRPTRTGAFEMACAELCGLGHYRMRARVFVQTAEEFERWQSTQVAPPAPAAAAPGTAPQTARTAS